MKRIALILGLFLLLAGCAQHEAEDRLARLEERYAALPGAAAEAEVTLRREADVLTYALAVDWEEDRIRVAVRAPEELAGITAELAGEALSLRYDGGVLDGLSASPGVSAVKAIPLLVRAVSEGYAVSSGEEHYGGADALRVSYETDCDGDAILCTLWFDAQDRPIAGEIEADGKIIVSAEFTSFQFGDILFQ